MKINSKAVLLCTLALAGRAAMAQFDSGAQNNVPLAIIAEDQYTIEENGASKTVLGSDIIKKVLEEGRSIPAIDSKGHKVIASRFYGGVAVYPFTAFTLAGFLSVGNQNFTGGTKTVSGATFATFYGARMPHGQSAELGAFVFRPDRSGVGGFYQLSGRYMFSPQFGAQLAYYSNTQGEKFKAYSYHALFRIATFTGMNKKGGAGSLSLGVGEQYNPETNPADAARSSSVTPSDTQNFSTFMNLSFELSDRVDLSTVWWYVRDRSVDLNRFSVGLSYRF